MADNDGNTALIFVAQAGMYLTWQIMMETQHLYLVAQTGMYVTDTHTNTQHAYITDLGGNELTV